MSDPVTIAEAAIAVGDHLSSELDEALAEYRLTRPSLLILSALAQAPDGSLGQRELLAHVRRTSGSVSVRLARLQRAGMIERAPDPANRRSVTVTVTERGRALAQRALPTYTERCERLVDALPGGADGPAAQAIAQWLAFFEPSADGAPVLGVAVAPPAVAKRMRSAVGLPEVDGILIVAVEDETPAARAELARGDLITAVGETQVSSVAELERALRAPGAGGAAGGGEIALTVLRGAEPRTVAVTIG